MRLKHESKWLCPIMRFTMFTGIVEWVPSCLYARNVAFVAETLMQTPFIQR